MDGSVEERVIQRLQAAGGIEVRPGGPGDLVVSVKGGETTLTLEVKHRFTESLVDRMDNLPPSEKDRTVLVIPELAPKRREELRFRNISWIEYRTGMVHLRVPHVAIDLPEEPVSETQNRKAIPSLAGKAGIIVEALIELGRQQEFVSQPEVAHLSGSTQAWTSQIFSALVEAEALEVMGRGPTKEWRPNIEALLRLWAADGGTVPNRTGMYLWSRTSRDLLQSLGEMGAQGLEYAIGEVAAANLHEPTLTSLPSVAVWIPRSDPPERVVADLGGEPVESGANVVLWQASGDPALRLSDSLGHWRGDIGDDLHQLSVVTPGRAVVESLQGTGRGPEVGEKLRQRLLEAASHLNVE